MEFFFPASGSAFIMRFVPNLNIHPVFISLPLLEQV